MGYISVWVRPLLARSCKLINLTQNTSDSSSLDPQAEHMQNIDPPSVILDLMFINYKQSLLFDPWKQAPPTSIFRTWLEVLCPTVLQVYGLMISIFAGHTWTPPVIQWIKSWWDDWEWGPIIGSLKKRHRSTKYLIQVIVNHCCMQVGWIEYNLNYL
jgi:hypothetical protein